MLVWVSKKDIIKYSLDYNSELLYSNSIREVTDMFEVLMEKQEPILGEMIENKFRKKLFSVSDNTLKSAKKELKYLYALRKILDILHNFQLVRRKKDFEKFKNYHLKLELEEEEMFIMKFCKQIDVNLLDKYFKKNNSEKSEFKFNDVFFDEFIQVCLNKLESVINDEITPAVENTVEDKPTEIEELQEEETDEDEETPIENDEGEPDSVSENETEDSSEPETVESPADVSTPALLNDLLNS